MKNIAVTEDTTAMTELRKELLALREEVRQLQKVNKGLSNRLSILRHWGIQMIHARNDWMDTADSKTQSGTAQLPQ